MSSTSEIVTSTLRYACDGTTLQGYLACPAGDGPHPAVIVAHEWWGLDDYVRGRARMLAELGYTALAIDLYGEGRTAATPDEAAALMNAVLGDMDMGARRLRAGVDALAASSRADAARMAAIGYCFGGAMVLHMARIGMDLRAVVSFHGALGSFHTPAPGSIKARVLICHGAEDVLVPDEQVLAIKAELDAAGAHYDFIAYPGALHGFSNPQATANGKKFGLPLAYDEAVDRQSWQAMQHLFARVLA